MIVFNTQLDLAELDTDQRKTHDAPHFVVFLWFVYSVRYNRLLVNRPNIVLLKIIAKSADQKIREKILIDP